jgi:hypothetical protein
VFTGRDTALTGSARKPTARSLRDEDDDLEEADWTTVGMVEWRKMEGILVVVGEFLRIDLGWGAVVDSGAGEI